jgi:hypothetical protein
MYFGARKASGGRDATSEAQQNNQSLMGTMMHWAKMSQSSRYSKRRRRASPRPPAKTRLNPKVEQVVVLEPGLYRWGPSMLVFLPRKRIVSVRLFAGKPLLTRVDRVHDDP